MGCAIIRDNIRMSNKVGNKFNGHMLKCARESRGTDLENCAKYMCIRKDYLREIELGLRFPTEIEISRFAELLNFPEPFFFRETYVIDPHAIMTICGSGIQPCSNCGEVADYLCDYPVGEGKTCDLHLCRKCRTHIGKYDFCPIHTQQNKVIRMIES